MATGLSTPKPATAPRRRRSPKPLPPPEPWEHRLLRLVAEQQAIPFDQLARFLGCGEAQAARVARHLAKARYAECDRILYDEPAWLWLTRRGGYHSGMGFKEERPKVGAMTRIRAVNEVRLHVTARAPAARWICRRALILEQGRRANMPSAVVEVEDERHAIAVLLASGGKEFLRGRVETIMARHDALIAFGPPPVTKLLERLQADHHWPKLVIREVPKPPQTGF